MNAFASGFLVLAGVALVCILWRWLALPCPWWLVPLLENPYFDFVAGPALLLDRAGVKQGMRVLDTGSGPGRPTLLAARCVGASGSVVGLDLQPRMIAQLKRRVADAGLHNVATVIAELGQNKLPAAEFDVAFLVTVLGEIRDQPSALRELPEPTVTFSLVAGFAVVMCRRGEARRVSVNRLRGTSAMVSTGWIGV